MKVIDIDKDEDMGKQGFSDLTNNILGKKPFVMLVHAHWCGHCKYMKVLMKQALHEIKKQKTKGELYAIVKISDNVARHVQTQHGDHLLSQILSDTVKGYPTMITVDPVKKNEVKIKFFDEQRTVENLKKFLTRRG